MAFSVNTNIASLQAQNYLRTSSEFQSKTINRVTSGLRIVSSGDDAAGLAIANGFRSDEAVLTQGIRNANDGLSTLQTIDGGINNISQLLDRARTLATQSASGTFTGGAAGRGLLNSEFKSVLTEIDRQAKSIGLDTGGEFAKSLAVFIGGGRGSDSSTVISNGSVAVDLSASTVDTGSLNLKGFSAGYQVPDSTTADSGYYDLGSGSAKTSVAQIIADNSATNTTITYKVSGPGFSAKTVSVNLAGVTDTTTLVSAINAGIASAAANDSQLKAANISAAVHTGADGSQQLRFNSTNSAFTVTAGSATANAFLGNFSTGTAGLNDASSGVGLATGTTADNFNAAGTQQVSAAFVTMVTANAEKQALSFTAVDSSGAPQSISVTLDAASADITADDAVTAINNKLQQSNIAALQSIVATNDGGTIKFSSASSSKFTVSFGAAYGTAATAKGFNADKNSVKTSDQVGMSSTADISTQDGAQAAVTALATAVIKLGQSQAAVGKGQNNFNYAINLAQSQVTNLAAAESRIRDADLANEAANLSKAQILVQAGTAALAQANSAPQAILSLLRG